MEHRYQRLEKRSEQLIEVIHLARAIQMRKAFQMFHLKQRRSQDVFFDEKQTFDVKISRTIEILGLLKTRKTEKH